MAYPPVGAAAVLRLAEEDPDGKWLLTVRAALAVHERIGGGSFAGRWVLNELKRTGDSNWWRPGLHPLVRAGILRKEGESTRGGDRSYYVFVDPEGVRSALVRLGY